MAPPARGASKFFSPIGEDICVPPCVPTVRSPVPPCVPHRAFLPHRAFPGITVRFSPTVRSPVPPCVPHRAFPGG